LARYYLACSDPEPRRYDLRLVARHLDIPHLLTYFVAHEGHHRGQIVMLERQLGRRLPDTVTAGLWQWTKRVHEVRGAR
jgi:uncharacterized damage-inducible protein DinB